MRLLELIAFASLVAIMAGLWLIHPPTMLVVIGLIGLVLSARAAQLRRTRQPEKPKTGDTP